MYEVYLTDAALRDLEEIDDYIAAADSQQRAEYVLGKIEEVFISLSQMPERGNYPKEMVMLGIKEYREVFFKPYRIVYRVQGKRVYIYLIADGRRDMQTLLSRRLLDT
ncbi:MAG: type II toxin-antitoxin system RelE/ParE family toxin [Gammaproteobacteria bacterium]|nr:type II toxin-antitoxin system RelE/ParE family toxin [Gammaproteobacteria bacterium]MDE0510357.1 type II toxin-antitoxin system RelE/ParE family toxin [Gammaproteobacteria bacterium]